MQLRVWQDIDREYQGVSVWGQGTLKLALLLQKTSGLTGTLKIDLTSM